VKKEEEDVDDRSAWQDLGAENEEARREFWEHAERTGKGSRMDQKQ